MNIDRMTRVNALLKREIGTTIIDVMNQADQDVSSVTVVDVVASRDLQHAKVKVSVRDDHQQRKPILKFLNHHRAEIQEKISRHVVLKYTPKLSFELDLSVEKGDRVLGILARMEPLETPPEPEE
mgnify:CR=1 FL=1